MHLRRKMAFVIEVEDNIHFQYFFLSLIIVGPWFDMYLKYRDSIVLNHNPFILTTDDPHTDNQVIPYS